MRSTDRRRVRRYRDRGIRVLVAFAAILAAGSPAAAQEHRGAFRFSMALGGFDTRDEVRSDSANILALVNPSGAEEDRFVDPRPDSAVTGKLQIQAGRLASVSAQYAWTKLVLLEGSLGWERGDVGDVEVQRLPSTIEPIRAGKLTRYPIDLRAVGLFRPDSRVRPFMAGGIGYNFVRFDSSPGFEELSRNLSQSMGQQARLQPASEGSQVSIFGIAPPMPLTGAEVSAGDAFEWHLAGGIEYTFGSHWAGVLEIRQTFSRGSVDIGFNGGEDLGTSVPQGTAPVDSEPAMGLYGPVNITSGGLLDVNGDGQPETGLYYVQGGSVDFDAFSFRIGARYKF